MLAIILLFQYVLLIWIHDLLDLHDRCFFIPPIDVQILAALDDQRLAGECIEHKIITRLRRQWNIVYYGLFISCVWSKINGLNLVVSDQSKCVTQWRLMPRGKRYNEQTDQAAEQCQRLKALCLTGQSIRACKQTSFTWYGDRWPSTAQLFGLAKLLMEACFLSIPFRTKIH